MSFDARANKYRGYTIPSENIIKKYATEMLLENYEDANILLSKYYDIFPATIEIGDNDDENFVGYDFVNHRIFYDLTKLPAWELRISALLLGFFRHLSCMKDWRFDGNAYRSMTKEKTEAEKFCQETIKKMLEIGIDPR